MVDTTIGVICLLVLLYFDIGNGDLVLILDLGFLKVLPLVWPLERDETNTVCTWP